MFSLEYEKEIFQELRLVIYESGNEAELSDDKLALAVTLNENLISLGYTMRPEDLCRIAVSSSIASFYDRMVKLVGEVLAKPMYPDFPKQVMEMEEAVFRMHQSIHYFSTYGMHILTGAPIRGGWFPDMPETEKTRVSDAMLPEKVIELLPAEYAYEIPVRRILSRRSRVESIAEKDILQTAIPLLDPDTLVSMEIPFKENLYDIFSMIMNQEQMSSEEKRKTLRCLCKHTGDVFKCLKQYLKIRKHHLRTSEKRLLVKLLESYPAADFLENLMPSHEKREKILHLLQCLDYNLYSRSEEHKQAVADLRSKKLSSWEGRARNMAANLAKGKIAEENTAEENKTEANSVTEKESREEILAFIAQRPGMLLRMIVWLRRIGYRDEEILNALLPKAGQLSTQTLIRILSGYKRNVETVSILGWYYEEYKTCSSWKNAYLRKQSMKMYRQIYRMIGLQKGQAERIKNTRMNDMSHRMTWLNAQKIKYNKIHTRLDEDSLKKMKEMILKLSADKNWRTEPMPIPAKDNDKAWKKYYEQYVENGEVGKRLDQEIQEENAFLSRFGIAMREIYKVHELAIINHYGDSLHKLMEADSRREQSLKSERNNNNRRFQQRYNRKKQLQAEKLEQADGFLQMIEQLILAKLAAISTPIKGKKVYLDSQGIDLTQSNLTIKKEKTGGYRGNNVAVTIPSEAVAIRFFVYWNDPENVDVDLHAYATTENGYRFKIGYDGEYSYDGIATSGDITCSDAAEYIDIMIQRRWLEKNPVTKVELVLDLFSGKDSFEEIKTCFAGVMAVEELDEDVELYDPKNCFFSQNIDADCSNIHYGSIDLESKIVTYIGEEGPKSRDFDDYYFKWNGSDRQNLNISIQRYIDMLCKAQGATIVSDPSMADVTLVPGKAIDESEIGLTDVNYYLDY